MSHEPEPTEQIDDEFGSVDGPRLEKYLARTCFGYALLLIFSFASPFFGTPTASVLGPILIPEIFADWESFVFFNRILLYGTGMAILSFVLSYQRSYRIGLRRFFADLSDPDKANSESNITRRDDAFVVPDLIGVNTFNPKIVSPLNVAYLLILLSAIVVIYGHEAATLGMTVPVKWGLIVGAILEVIIGWYYLTMRSWIRSHDQGETIRPS